MLAFVALLLKPSSLLVRVTQRVSGDKPSSSVVHELRFRCIRERPLQLARNFNWIKVLTGVFKGRICRVGLMGRRRVENASDELTHTSYLSL